MRDLGTHVSRCRLNRSWRLEPLLISCEVEYLFNQFAVIAVKNLVFERWGECDNLRNIKLLLLDLDWVWGHLL